MGYISDTDAADGPECCIQPLVELDVAYGRAPLEACVCVCLGGGGGHGEAEAELGIVSSKIASDLPALPGKCICCEKPDGVMA